jgi:thermostable 8-oxoguanine DNA glycosylase
MTPIAMPPTPLAPAEPRWLDGWRALRASYESAAARPAASEAALRQELCFCLLGGHAVSYELARSATDVVMALDPFNPRWSGAELCRAIEGELSAAKFDPRRRDGSLRRYRFPARKAALLRSAAAWVGAGAGLGIDLRRSQSEGERREWLCGCPGIGPKSASWFLRNTGYAEDLAILDVHILRAMRDAGRLGTLELPRDYLAVEARFRTWCEEIGASVAAFDLFLWEWQRGDIAPLEAA